MDESCIIERDKKYVSIVCSNDFYCTSSTAETKEAASSFENTFHRPSQATKMNLHNIIQMAVYCIHIIYWLMCVKVS